MRQVEVGEIQPEVAVTEAETIYRKIEQERFLELQEMFNKHTQNGLIFFNTVYQDFVDKLKKKYTPYDRNTKLWHMIIGSSPDETTVNFDLPDIEIENFIRNILPKFEPTILE